MTTMQPFKAKIVNGHFVSEDRIDLPEGTELYLVAAAEDDDMSPEDRAEVNAAIQEGLADLKAGRSFDADEVIDELLARQ